MAMPHRPSGQGLSSPSSREIRPAHPNVKYVGPAGTGIAAHRLAMLDERQNAAQAGARLFNSSENKSAESGDALRIRFAAETATLTSIAQSSAQGLEKALRHIAVMIGQDPAKVVVKPNLSFVDSTLTPADAAALVSVWQNGAISDCSGAKSLQWSATTKPNWPSSGPRSSAARRRGWRRWSRASSPISHDLLRWSSDRMG